MFVVGPPQAFGVFGAHHFGLAFGFMLVVAPHPAACLIIGTHPNVERREGSRPSQTHVWASDRS